MLAQSERRPGCCNKWCVMGHEMTAAGTRGPRLGEKAKEGERRLLLKTNVAQLKIAWGKSVSEDRLGQLPPGTSMGESRDHN